MVVMRQGVATMGEPSKLLERLVLSGKLRHGDNPVLRWMAGNVSVRIDANGNYMPDKSRAARNRIDGIVATIMALGRAMVNVEQTSVYSSHGVQFI